MLKLGLLCCDWSDYYEIVMVVDITKTFCTGKLHDYAPVFEHRLSGTEINFLISLFYVFQKSITEVAETYGYKTYSRLLAVN